MHDCVVLFVVLFIVCRCLCLYCLFVKANNSSALYGFLSNPDCLTQLRVSVSTLSFPALLSDIWSKV